MLILNGAILKNHQLLKLPLDDQIIQLYYVLIQQNRKIREYYGESNTNIFISAKGTSLNTKSTNNAISKQLTKYSKRFELENINAHAEYVRSVMSASEVPQTPENFELHQMAFERMANLMLKGTEIHIERQINNNNEDSNEAPVLLPNLESVKGLIELYRDTLLEHNSEFDSSDED